MTDHYKKKEGDKYLVVNKGKKDVTSVYMYVIYTAKETRRKRKSNYKKLLLLKEPVDILRTKGNCVYVNYYLSMYCWTNVSYSTDY